MRRNRTGVLASSTVTIALVASLGVAIWSEQSQRKARLAAETDRKSAEAVATFLAVDLLGQAAPARAGRDASVVTLLDAARDRLDHRTDLEPAEERIIRQAIGSAYLALGRPESAEPQLRRAVSLSAAIDKATLDLATAWYMMRRYDEAEQQAKRVIAYVQSDPNAELLAIARDIYAACLKRANRYNEALELYDSILEEVENQFGPNSHESWSVRYNIALTIGSIESRKQEATTMLEKVIEAYEQIGSPAAEASWINAAGELARNLQDAGQLAESEAMYRRVLPVALRIQGEGGRRVTMTRTHLAMVIAKEQRFPEAIELLRAALNACDVESPVSIEAVSVARRLGDILLQAGEWEEAERVLRYRLELQPPGPAGELEAMASLLEQAQARSRGGQSLTP
jgi:tetratricopeptide (TPR) repeat protein